MKLTKIKLTKSAYRAKKHGKAKRRLLKNKRIRITSKSIVNG